MAPTWLRHLTWEYYSSIARWLIPILVLQCISTDTDTATRRPIPYHDVVAAAVWWVSFASCPCSACSGTRHEWHVSWVQSSRLAGPSSARQVVDWQRSRCAACEAVSRSIPSVSASFSSLRRDVITPTFLHATSRDATNHFRFRLTVSCRCRRRLLAVKFCLRDK